MFSNFRRISKNVKIFSETELSHLNREMSPTFLRQLDRKKQPKICYDMHFSHSVSYCVIAHYECTKIFGKENVVETNSEQGLIKIRLASRESTPIS